MSLWCRNRLMAQGEPYPKTCPICGLGPCREGVLAVAGGGGNGPQAGEVVAIPMALVSGPGGAGGASNPPPSSGAGGPAQWPMPPPDSGHTTLELVRHAVHLLVVLGAKQPAVRDTAQWQEAHSALGKAMSKLANPAPPPIEGVKVTTESGVADAAARYLWGILDDIDTVSDMAKHGPKADAAFRRMVEHLISRRWDAGEVSEAGALTLKAPPPKEDEPT